MIVVVMGSSGSGKSVFIEKVLKEKCSSEENICLMKNLIKASESVESFIANERIVKESKSKAEADAKTLRVGTEIADCLSRFLSKFSKEQLDSDDLFIIDNPVKSYHQAKHVGNLLKDYSNVKLVSIENSRNDDDSLEKRDEAENLSFTREWLPIRKTLEAATGKKVIIVENTDDGFKNYEQIFE